MAKKDFDSLGFVPHGESEEDPFSKLGFTSGEPKPVGDKMSPFESAVTGINAGGGNVAHGAIQGLLEAEDHIPESLKGVISPNIMKGASNLSEKSKAFAKQRAQDYKKAAEDNPTSALAGNMLGGLAASSPTFLIPGVGQSAIPRAISQGVMQGGVSGAAGYGTGQERALNTAIGAGAGAVGYPIAKGLGSANPLTKFGTGAGLVGGGKYAYDKYNGKEGGKVDALGYGIAGGIGALVPGAAVTGVKNIGRAFRGEPMENVIKKPFETIAKNKMLSSLSPKQIEKALSNSEAAKRLGLDYITLGEASGSPTIAKTEGGLGRSPKGQEKLFDKMQGREESEVTSINNLLNDISKETGPAQEKVRGAAQEFVSGKKAALQQKASPYYKKALEESNPPVDINPVIEHIKGLQKNSAGEMSTALNQVMKDLGGEPKYTINAATGQKTITNPELAKMHNVKIAIDAMLEGRGDSSIARATKGELIGIKNKLLEQMDRASPDYKKARSIFAEGEGTVEGAKALSAINNSEIAKIADLKDTQLKDVARNIFSPQQTDMKVIGKLRDRISSVDPQAWNNIVRNELERVMDKKDMSGFSFYKQNLEGTRRFNHIMEATKNIPGANERLQDMRKIFKNLMTAPTARIEAGLKKTNMSSERDPIAAIRNYMGRMAGSEYEMAQINLTTNPHWDKELNQISKIKNKMAQASQFSGLMARILTNTAATSNNNSGQQNDN